MCDKRSALDLALADVETAFRQLEFAIKLLSYVEVGNIEPANFDTDRLIALPSGGINLPSGHFSEQASILAAANINVLVTFSATVLVLDKALEIADATPNPESEDDFTKIRTLIYMLRCAQAHGIACPQWEVRGKYLRVISFSIDDARVELDLTNLNGKPFDVEQIGGYPRWYKLRDLGVSTLEAA